MKAQAVYQNDIFVLAMLLCSVVDWWVL